MRKLYEYLYYRLYSYMQITPNRVNAVEGAVALLTGIIILYLMSLCILSSSIIDTSAIRKIPFVIAVVVITFLIYYLNLKYFQRHINIIKMRYEKESKKKQLMGKFIIILVSVGSLLAMYTADILKLRFK